MILWYLSQIGPSYNSLHTLPLAIFPIATRSSFRFPILPSFFLLQGLCTSKSISESSLLALILFMQLTLYHAYDLRSVVPSSGKASLNFKSSFVMCFRRLTFFPQSSPFFFSGIFITLMIFVKYLSCPLNMFYESKKPFYLPTMYPQCIRKTPDMKVLN